MGGFGGEVGKHCLPGHRLFRSSSPNYLSPREDAVNGGDKSQRLTQDAVKWLTENKINSIISFNQFSYKPEELALLSKANITYRHFCAEDFHSPSIENLKAAVMFHAELKDASTLVHCGYGHGRTGTGISAIQLYVEDGKQPTKMEWIAIDHVEPVAVDHEVENLQILAEFYQKNPRPRD